MPSYALTMPFRPALDGNAVPIAGAQAVLTYSGGTTLAPVYSDTALTIPASANDQGAIVANAAGRFGRVYLNDAIDYRLRIFDADADITVATPLEDFDPYDPQEVGATGPAGPNATILQIGTVTTVSAGGSATAGVNSLGSGLYSLDLGIPRGNTGASGALSDGTFGDIVVSGTGTVLTVGAAAISNSKMANMATATVKGRATGAGSGAPTDIAIGTGASTSIIDRAAGDGRYILQSGTRVISMWVPAAAFKPRTSNGAATGSTETTTNKVNFDTLDYDSSSDEFAQFAFAPPKSWNESTITAQPLWTASAGTPGQTVDWAIRGVALSDDDAADTAFGTAITVTDTLLATGDIHIGAFSSAITIGGTPAEGDLVVLQVGRTTSTDNLSGDAKLIGIRLNFTVNAQDDS